MLDFLKLEFKKVNNYRPFRVMAIFYVILLPLSLLVTKSFPQESGIQNFFGMQGFYEFPKIWEYLGYIGSWIVFFFLGFIGVLTVTNEFTNKTLRQSIINGLSRKDVFWSKVYFVAAVSLVATLYFYLCGAIIGVFHEDPFYFSDLTNSFDYIFRYFLMCFGFMIFGTFLGMLFRRTGLAIFLFLAYGIFIEPILKYLHLYLTDNSRTALYYPLNAMEDLTPIPFSRVIEGLTRDMGFDPFLDPSESIIVSVIYIGLLLLGINRLLVKRDL